MPIFKRNDDTEGRLERAEKAVKRLGREVKQAQSAPAGPDLLAEQKARHAQAAAVIEAQRQWLNSNIPVPQYVRRSATSPTGMVNLRTGKPYQFGDPYTPTARQAVAAMRALAAAAEAAEARGGR
jgi:hypothetical protein